MLKKRLIPKILIDETPGSPGRYSACVSLKYSQFSRIGTLGSQLKILESNRVDELLIVNTIKSENPISDSLVSYIKEAISDLKTPVTVGGGIDSIVDAEQLIASGADKLLIGINRANFPLINSISSKFGAQAVVGSIDYSFFEERYLLRGQLKDIFDLDHLVSLAANAQSAGIGEVLLNCIDNDGQKNGFDLQTVSHFHNNLSLPVTLASGAGKSEHFVSAFKAGADAVSAGTYFSKLDQSPLQLRSRLLNEGILLRK